MLKDTKGKLKNIPNDPGCYKFYSKTGELIYIGKAKNLKKRISSYFIGRERSRPFPTERLDSKTKVLVERIADIKWEITESEIEALILESLLIKKFKPRFNIKIKDDKDFLWVKINLGKDFPQPELIRRPNVETQGFASLRKIKFFGPFTDPKLLKQGLNILRKVFLWRDCSSSKFSFYEKRGKPCLEYYIKNCNAPCAGFVHPVKSPTGRGAEQFDGVNADDYQSGIKRLVMFLEGKKAGLIRDLKKEMSILAKGKRFEEAAIIRDKIHALEHINVSLNHKSQITNHKQIPNSKFQITKNIISILNKELGYSLKYKKDFRVEFYDISNISGKEATGSMIVWKGDSFAKNQYRKFKIRTVRGSNDVGMMREVLIRRLKYLKPHPPIGGLNLKNPGLMVKNRG